MKKRLLITTIICSILCLSLLFCSCDLRQGGDVTESVSANKTEQETLPPKTNVEVIVDDITSVDLGAIVDELGKASDTTLDKATEDILCNLNFSAAMGGETINGYLGYKDNIFKVTTSADTAQMIGALLGNSIATFTSSMGGYIIDVETNEEYKDEIDDFLSDDVLNIIKEFKFPQITEDQFTQEGDYYIVNNEYLNAVAEKIVDAGIEVAKKAGLPEEAVPSGEDRDELVDAIKNVIESVNLKFGFAVSNQKISGFILSADTTVYELAEMMDSSAEDIEDGPVSATIEAKFIPETYAPTYLKVSVNAQSGSEQINIFLELDVILGENNIPVGLNAKLDYSAPTNSYYGSFEYGEEDEWGYRDYATVYLAGQDEYTITAFIDLSLLGSAKGTNIATVSVNNKSVYSNHYVEIYDEDDGDYIKVDPSSLGIELDIDLNDEGYEHIYSAQITSEGENKLNYLLEISESDSENMTVSGELTYDFEAADDFGDVPDEITSLTSDPDFIEKFNSLKEKADTALELIYFDTFDDDYSDEDFVFDDDFDFDYEGGEDDDFDFDFDYNDTYDQYYIWQDSETGLYVVFEGYYSTPYIRTNKIEDSEFIEITIDFENGIVTPVY